MARNTPDPLELEIERALAPGDFIAYRACYGFVSRLERVEEKLAALVRQREGERAAALYEAFLAGCYAKIEELDDSGGELGMFVDSLFRGWIRARQAAGADPAQTAERLARWKEHDDYGFAHAIEREAVEVLDAEGLSAFAAAMRRRLERPPAGRAFSRRFWVSALRAVYEKQGDVASYLALSEGEEPSAKDCAIVAGVLQRSGELDEALRWVERGLALEAGQTFGRSAYELGRLQRELLAALGRNDALRTVTWEAFAAAPSVERYNDLMAAIAEGERGAWHERAMETAGGSADLFSVLRLWLETGELDRLVRRIEQTTDATLEGLSHYSTEPVARRLERDHPAQAARVFRALGVRILASRSSKRSQYYPAALDHFERARGCYRRAARGEDWEGLVSWVRANHSRKSSFIGGFEELASGADRAPEPTFLEKAKARWSEEH